MRSYVSQNRYLRESEARRLDENLGCSAIATLLTTAFALAEQNARMSRHSVAAIKGVAEAGTGLPSGCRRIERGDVQQLLETMHIRIGLLTMQPGFISMSLHASLDGKQTAVYAQWADEATLTAAINLPEAKRSHEEMSQWRTSDGSQYVVDSVHLPGMASKSQAQSANT